MWGFAENMDRARKEEAIVSEYTNLGQRGANWVYDFLQKEHCKYLSLSFFCSFLLFIYN